MINTDPNTTRWTVTVSKNTDISIRPFLAQRGLKKSDLSKFIEDAVRWRILDQTLRNENKITSTTDSLSLRERVGERG